jgi:hypothetical protein
MAGEVYTGVRVRAYVHQGIHNYNLVRSRRARGRPHSAPREHACPREVWHDWGDDMLVARCTATVIAMARSLSVPWVFQLVMMFEKAMVCVAFLWRTSSKRRPYVVLGFRDGKSVSKP